MNLSTVQDHRTHCIEVITSRNFEWRQASGGTTEQRGLGGLHTRVSLGLVEEDVAAVLVGNNLCDLRMKLKLLHSLDNECMALAVARLVVFRLRPIARGHVVVFLYLEGSGCYAALEERGICDTPRAGRFMNDWSCPGQLASTLRTNGQNEAAYIALQVLLHQKHAANALFITPSRL